MQNIVSNGAKCYEDCIISCQMVLLWRQQTLRHVRKHFRISGLRSPLGRWHLSWSLNDGEDTNFLSMTSLSFHSLLFTDLLPCQCLSYCWFVSRKNFELSPDSLKVNVNFHYHLCKDSFFSYTREDRFPGREGKGYGDLWMVERRLPLGICYWVFGDLRAV